MYVRKIFRLSVVNIRTNILTRCGEHILTCSITKLYDYSTGHLSYNFGQHCSLSDTLKAVLFLEECKQYTQIFDILLSVKLYSYLHFPLSISAYFIRSNSFLSFFLSVACGCTFSSL